MCDTEMMGCDKTVYSPSAPTDRTQSMLFGTISCVRVRSLPLRPSPPVLALPILSNISCSFIFVFSFCFFVLRTKGSC